jgi:hypothetical protein
MAAGAKSAPPLGKYLASTGMDAQCYTPASLLTVTESKTRKPETRLSSNCHHFSHKVLAMETLETRKP